MRNLALVKRLVAFVLTLGFLAVSSPGDRAAGGPAVSVTITSVSGDAGHSFVFAQVSDSFLTYPAPTGTTHLSPYYSEWIREPFTTPTCPWIWAVYVFNRFTSTQVNAPPPTAPLPNFGTTTLVCASPTTTPVDQPALANASAELDLDLQVGTTPPVAVAGSPTLVSAVLGSGLSQDMNLYLNIAIDDWAVTGWSVSFGDGQSVHLKGGTATAIQVAHTYRSAGTYDARVLATIAGHAQAAIYDVYGSPKLIRRPFTVDIGNHALAAARPQPIRRYLPPSAAVAVSPSLDGTNPDASAPAFRHIDALRGSLTTLQVHLLITRDGQLTLDGRPVGFGRSVLTGWRLEGVPSDAPSGTGTNPGVIHPANDVLRLQWNAPDRIQGTQPQAYAVAVTLFVETHFPDGHVGSYAIASSFSVSVGFAAESG